MYKTDMNKTKHYGQKLQQYYSYYNMLENLHNYATFSENKILKIMTKQSWVKLKVHT